MAAYQRHTGTKPCPAIKRTSSRAKRDLDDPVALKLRFNEALRRRIAAAAKASLRSLNSEIVFRLKTSLDQGSDKAAA